MSEGERGQRRRGIGVCVSGAAVGLAVAHMIWPDLAIDTITVMLLVVAVLPWLGGVFDSIELPGGPRLEYRRLESRIEAAEERTTRLDQEVDGATAAARVALAAAGSGDVPDARAAMERLAAEYTELRRSMTGSPLRTAHQERVFADLVKVTPRVADMDVVGMLASDDPGQRLAAYARLYAAPEVAMIGPLVDAVVGEPTHFSAYWGFNVLGRMVDEAGAEQVPVGVLRKLRAHLPDLPEGSSRARALRRVLARLMPD